MVSNAVMSEEQQRFSVYATESVVKRMQEISERTGVSVSSLIMAATIYMARMRDDLLYSVIEKHEVAKLRAKRHGTPLMQTYEPPIDPETPPRKSEADTVQDTVAKEVRKVEESFRSPSTPPRQSRHHSA